jgi:glucose-6-phosphate dehydrogenase assembly protein OpcA
MSSAIIFPAQPEQILKGLSKVWTSLGEEEKQQGKPTVLRACAMTLIIATDDPDGGYSASQTISQLMREHPSRGIVLAVSDQAERGLEARVFAQCWKPFGKAQQICCEQIEITARPENWPKIGPTLVGLIAADLPVIFWCRHNAALSPSATPDQKAGLQAVIDLSTKVIIDTAEEDGPAAFALINQLRGTGRVAVADLEWTRLTHWREPIAQLFDSSCTSNQLSKFHTVEIAYAGQRPTPSAFYAAGWLSAPYKPTVSLVKTDGFGPGLHRITLRSDSEQIDFERTGTECMQLRSTSGRQRSYSFSEIALDTLMNEELSVLGPDPAFLSAFMQAQELIRGR